MSKRVVYQPGQTVRIRRDDYACKCMHKADVAQLQAAGYQVKIVEILPSTAFGNLYKLDLPSQPCVQRSAILRAVPSAATENKKCGNGSCKCRCGEKGVSDKAKDATSDKKSFADILEQLYAKIPVESLDAMKDKDPFNAEKIKDALSGFLDGVSHISCTKVPLEEASNIADILDKLVGTVASKPSTVDDSYVIRVPEAVQAKLTTYLERATQLASDYGIPLLVNAVLRQEYNERQDGWESDDLVSCVHMEKCRNASIRACSKLIGQYTAPDIGD